MTIFLFFSPERRILARLNTLKQEIKHMAGELAALQAGVQKNTDVIESAITLIGNIKTLLDAAIASGDPAALTALSTTLGAEDDRLAQAVASNTPAAAPAP
jgi:hypothetical protein